LGQQRGRGNFGRPQRHNAFNFTTLSHHHEFVDLGARQQARWGEGAWKGAYSLVSLLGLVLIVWGYGQARQQPTALWSSPVWTRHLAALLTVPAFVLLVAAYVPGNGIKAAVKHPMVLGVKVWALAHLIANNTLADLLLFGGFLLWAVLCFRAARQRDRALQTAYPAGTLAKSLLTLALGLLGWAVFAFWAHGALIGVRPFGRVGLSWAELG
jgi:uncharacterized membrane protein